jgi:predicted amino acid racemase
VEKIIVNLEKYKENAKKIFQLLSRMKILLYLKKEPDEYGRLCKAAKLDNQSELCSTRHNTEKIILAGMEISVC